MPELPRGTVTFLFTDVEGSTGLWQDHPAAMQRADDRHDAILRGAVSQHGGVVYKVVGDAFQVAFPTAPGAVAAALEALLGLEFADWAAVGLTGPLRVRMAVHAGAVEPAADGDYRSPVLNRLGRLLGAGHGGQALVSQAVRQLARDRLPEDVALRDLGEHRLRDLLEPERVFQLDHPALAEEFPPLRTLDARPHNLPVQPTPFLGREREVERAVALLRRDDARLLTLTGPGGTGKTRLGLQVAAELLDDFADGVVFVGLAPVTDPALVPAVVGEALGVREEGARPIRERLVDELRPKHLLLVLDNFEQLTAAAPVVTEWLVAAPNVKVLVTSRAALHLRAEHEQQVPPLGLPARDKAMPADQVSMYEAVRLFIARAQAVRADFAVTNDNAPAVAEICHRLDGLPLAIELAAARIRLLPPQAMLARLEQRLGFLTGGARDLPERQRTLRGAIGWSYDLLTPDEQALHRRLAVCAGAFGLDAAEAVAGTPASGELGVEVLDGLERLVDHSLLRQDPAAGEPRFAMLATIREYGLERLTASGEEAEARARHAAHFLALAEAADRELRAGKEIWLDRLEVDHDDLRAALGWSAVHDADTALRLAAALRVFWRTRGHLREAKAWLDRVLSATATAAPTARANALAGAAYIAVTLGEVAEAERLSMEGMVLARETAEPRVLAEALNAAASTAMQLGDFDRAEPLLVELLDLARHLSDDAGVVRGVGNLGEVARLRGDLEEAGRRYHEALDLALAAGLSSAAALWRLNLGLVARHRADLVGAAEHYREALRYYESIGDREGVPYAVAGLGGVALERGGVAQGARLLAAMDALLTTIGAVLEPSEHALFAADTARARAALGEQAFTAAWATGRTLPLAAAVAEALAVGDDIAAAGAMAESLSERADA